MKIRALATVVLAVSTLALAACGEYHKSYEGFPYGVRTAGSGVAVYDGKKAPKKAEKAYKKSQQK